MVERQNDESNGSHDHVTGQVFWLLMIKCL
jgi:hypothetical protein